MLARLVAIALVLFLVPGLVPPLRAELSIPISSVFEVEVRPGVTVKYLGVRILAKKAPNAVILFAGGNGLLSLQPDGSIGTDLSGNFLVRSRVKFAQKNLFVAVVDTPNQVKIDGSVRLSAEYADDLGQVIEDVRGRIAPSGKVWVVGTSSGTLSAASIAARLPLVTPPIKDNLRRPDGIILTSTQTTRVAGLCGKTVFDAKLAAINVPAFVAAHVKDACACSPPKASAMVIFQLTGAPTKSLRNFSGGKRPKSKDPCMAFTPHGFYGIEDSVVGLIAKFISAH